VCEHRPSDGEIVELMLEALRGEVAADAARDGVPCLQAIETGVDAAKAVLQGEELELAKHDGPPTM
jgi:hypothetical protein